MDYLQDNSAYPFICICEGHLHSTVSLRVLHKERESQLIVAAAGDSWYEAKSSVDLIVDKQDYVEFLVTPMDPKQKRLVKIPLEGFPNRPDRTTRLGISFGFLDEKTMAVVLKDKGLWRAVSGYGCGNQARRLCYESDSVPAGAGKTTFLL